MKKLALFVILTSLATGAYAQAPAVPATPGAAPAAAPAKPLGMADKKFIKDLSGAVLTEQKYLEAFTTAKPTLTETAQRDMSKMTGELKRVWTALSTLATTKGAEVAAEVPKSDLSKVEKLGKEKPDKFAKEFFKDFGKETAKTAKLIESAKTVVDPEVKIFVEDWSAILKGHDKAAASAEKSLSAKK